MKKRMLNIKKALSVLVLSAMAVCAVAPTVQAYSFVKSGSRGNDDGYYNSITTVEAYTDAGYVAKARAGAKMPDQRWTYVSEPGEAVAISPKTLTYGSAWHAYGVNEVTHGEWMEN